ncbi:hypothetical protein N1851_014070 [Merluccius polli]|uniref:Uncharacterized protein n=1 Tax=Merluccius polli TaxID=89951 RepID=A0AA47P338_MERPO|nr:hypothetical protein N1851_014070 [Merluccius polli]
MPELRPKQECVTRWNSAFHMLKGVLESKDAIISTLAIINAPVDALSQEEWEVVRETCTVLEPFEQVTVEISADSLQNATPVQGSAENNSPPPDRRNSNRESYRVGDCSLCIYEKKVPQNGIQYCSLRNHHTRSEVQKSWPLMTTELLMRHCSSSKMQPRQPTGSTTRRARGRRGSRGPRCGATNVCCLEAL